MKLTAISVSLLLLLTGCATSPRQDADPHRWLEAVDDPQALAWVAKQNERTRLALTAVPRFAEMQQQALAALSSESRVPTVEYHGRYLYNLWKDADHPRGIYRRTTLDELRKPSPRWTTVLDIDKMSRRDGKLWVFKGLDCLAPENRRCLVSLSAGGGDAIVVREWDAETLRFVDEGFVLAEAKSRVRWMDADNLFVATDYGPGTLTESGYPRILKRWTRGTPLSSAVTLHEVPPSSVGVIGRRYRSEGGNIDVVTESLTTWTARFFVLEGARLVPLDLPPSAGIRGALDGKLVVTLQEPWGDLPAGSVALVGRGVKRVIAASTATSIIETSSVEVMGNRVLVPSLENVRARLRLYTSDGQSQSIPVPENGALSSIITNDDSGDVLFKFETFTTPPALYHYGSGSSEPVVIRAQQPTFDGSRFVVTQQWAVSKDDTRIPYFVVGAKGFARDGSSPTHIFTYGGFRNALTPSYSGSYEPHYGAYGKLWLERGGVFVLANIRGGGEFGPAWHSSVLKQNRHKVFEDFEAVAEDLVRTGVTTRARLGIEGRSNGGLLTLATMVRRPELYGGVISGAPLADMQRYHEMLAGASWMAEYGDPRVPAEWDALRAYSPYQNFRADAKYPPLFVYASTRDDRVHPGHARKVVAKLQEQGHDVLYFENVEGGHGGSSTNEQLAYRIALSYAHLWKSLGGR